MAKRRFVPGSIVAIRLPDGSYSYGRLRKFPFVALYDYRTSKVSTDLREIVTKPVLFTVAVHKSALDKGKWEILGRLPLEDHLLERIEEFMQDPTQPEKCRIIDEDDNIRDARVEECVGLERASVWDPEGVEDRLLDHYLGRENPLLEHSKLKGG